MRKKKIDTIPVLTDSIRDILISYSNSRFLPASFKQRFQIVLLASEGVNNKKIDGKVGPHYNNVATWRNRFLNAMLVLKEIEMASPEKLPGKFKHCLQTNTTVMPNQNPW